MQLSMTENLAVSASLTSLATQLTSGANKPHLIEFRGTMTPQQLDAPALETAALAKGAAAHDLGWMRRVMVRGEDRLRWLSGMVTNTVNDIPENGGTWNLVLNAQGRIQGRSCQAQHRPQPVADDVSVPGGLTTRLNFGLTETRISKRPTLYI